MSARKWLLVLLALVTLTLVSCSGDAGQSEQAENASCPYLLPFDGTREIQVSQGNSEKSSHNGAMEYAFDFDLERGDPILAARAGIVSKVHDGETACGGQDKIGNANYVVIDHRDGTFATYLHLQAGILVTEDQEVQQGQVIGYTGNTGQTYCQSSLGGGYHLHFQVQSAEKVGSQSIPICFADVEGDGVPRTDDWVRSQNLQQGTVLVPGPEVGEIGGFVSGKGQVGSSEILPEGVIAYRIQHEGGSTGIDYIHPGEEQATTIVASPENIGGFSWSPDGSKIVYVLGSVSGNGEYVNILEPLNLAGEVTIVRPEVSPAGPAFSPTYYSYVEPRWSADGRYVFLTADDGRVGGFSLWRVKIENHDRQEVIVNLGSFDFDISWASGGVALTEWFNGHNGFGMFLLSQNGEIIKTLFDPREHHTFHNPDWSPDGRLIAFEAAEFFGEGTFGTSGIWTINSDGSNPELLIADGQDPDWSPDGNWLAYALRENNQTDIWIVSVEGGSPINITNTPDVSESSPNWRP